MTLVPSRPIPLPVWKSGNWYDDFAVTGAVEPGYSLAGAKDKTSNVIRLRATTGPTSTLTLPSWFGFSNFKVEYVMKRVAGTTAIFQFRYLNANNRWFINLNSLDVFKIARVVSGVNTDIASLGSVISTSWQKIGINAVGSNIFVYLNGKRVFTVNDTANINYKFFSLEVYDATVGIAQSDFQYLAIKPL